MAAQTDLVLYDRIRVDAQSTFNDNTCRQPVHTECLILCQFFFPPPLRSYSRCPDLSPVVPMRVHLQSSSVIMYAQIKCIYACVDGLNAGGVRCFAISARGCDISRGARAKCQVVLVPERVLLIRLEDVSPRERLSRVG